MGTKEGGKAAAITNKRLYGDDFYHKIGAKGGANGTTGGFYANRELARTAGMKGGHKSRRGPAKSASEREAARKKYRQEWYQRNKERLAAKHVPKIDKPLTATEKGVMEAAASEDWFRADDDPASDFSDLPSQSWSDKLKEKLRRLI